MRKFKQVSEEERKEICRLYIEERKGASGIAKLFGCTAKPIQRILKESWV